jgi:hypothetical protein
MEYSESYRKTCLDFGGLQNALCPLEQTFLDLWPEFAGKDFFILEDLKLHFQSRANHQALTS